jgi:alkylation response protein AidB-like acyl-CoA dehydrogenase
LHAAALVATMHGMDVRLSPEQRALRDSVGQVVDRLGPPAVGQLDDWERAAKLDAAVAESGWRELRTPDEDGRPWASAVEVALVAEQLARGAADAAFVGPTLAAELRRLAGAPEATGAETVALRPDLSALATTGGAAVALDAFGDADALLLAAAGDAHTLVTSRVRERGGGTDLTRPSAPLLTADAVALAGQSKQLTEADLARWAALGLVIGCGDLVGVMQGALDLTVGYAKERHQYGKPIGSFQALQHLMADMAVHLEGARSATLHAAWAVDALEANDAFGVASAAKAYAARGARAVCESAIQVHGGIGHTWECMAHVFLRRALLSTDLLGGIGACLDRVLDHAGVGGGRV